LGHDCVITIDNSNKHGSYGNDHITVVLKSANKY